MYFATAMANIWCTLAFLPAQVPHFFKAADAALIRGYPAGGFSSSVIASLVSICYLKGIVKLNLCERTIKWNH